MLIDKNKSSLIVIDVQEKLVSVMPKPQIFIENIIKLQKAANILQVPVTYSEQYPNGLGKTINKIKENTNPKDKLIEKTEFSVSLNIFLKFPKKWPECFSIVVQGIMKNSLMSWTTILKHFGHYFLFH